MFYLSSIEGENMNSYVNGTIFESKDSVKKAKAEKLMFQCFNSGEQSTTPLTVSKQLKEWNSTRQRYLDNIDMLETYKQCLHNMDDALYFAKNSYTQKMDLVKLLNTIKTIEHKKKIVALKELEKEVKYNKAQLHSLIEKLKLLGEIFDPYIDNKKKKGQFLKVI